MNYLHRTLKFKTITTERVVIFGDLRSVRLKRPQYM